MGEAKDYNCIICNKSYKSYLDNSKFCSLECKGKSQMSKVDSDMVITLYQSGLTQHEVASKLGITQKVVFNTLK